MAYIDLDLDETANPGIRGLLRYRPLTGGPLAELAEALLRGPNSLTRGERELIAAHVSALNDCAYCARSHGATAAALGLPVPDDLGASSASGGPGASVSGGAGASSLSSSLSGKLRALLVVAAATRESGHAVTPAIVAEARAAGATDLEIHDTVLIAAAFSMFNRYVDALGAFTPTDPADYEAGAGHIAAHGYLARPRACG